MWTLLLFSYIAVTTAIIVDTQYPLQTTYNFVYAVNDPHTRDIKNQWEQRIGDRVQGSYKIAEPDGTTRIVDYYADGKNGFRAFVRREGQAYHKIAVPIQPYQTVIPVSVGVPDTKRDYFGATFVPEKDYGRGLGYYK